MSDDQQPPEGPKLDLSKMSREDLEALFLRLEEVDRSRANLGIHFMGALAANIKQFGEGHKTLNDLLGIEEEPAPTQSEPAKAEADGVGEIWHWDNLGALSHQDLQRLGCNFLQWQRVKRASLDALREKIRDAHGDAARIVSQFLTVEDETDKRFGAVLREILAPCAPKKGHAH